MKGPSENSTAKRTSTGERSSLASTVADLRELKINSTATVQELQQFLRELRGKSPQELLGVVASSQLIRATILAVILVTVAIFALTAFPYFFGEQSAAEPEPTALASAAPAPEPEPEPTSVAAAASAPATEAEPKPSSIKTPQTPGPLAPLGVNEKLPAAPNKNPLEDKGEDFLKDLE